MAFDWQGLDKWQQWMLGIGTSLAAGFIIWVCTRLFGNGKAADSGVTFKQNASPVMTQTFHPTINIHPPPTAAVPVALQDMASPARLELAFDKDDPSCVRTWADGHPHHLYRLKATNCSNTTEHDVRVVIEGVVPLRQDILHASLVAMHYGLAEGTTTGAVNRTMAPIELGPKQPGYFDLFEYNSRDADTGRPVFLVWHTIPHVPVHVAEADHYEFTLRAYSRECCSEAITVSFTRTSMAHYRFDQEASSATHSAEREQMVFEDSLCWKRKNGEREGPYCPNCYDDKKKEIHLTPGATKGTYSCGICQNGFM